MGYDRSTVRVCKRYRYKFMAELCAYFLNKSTTDVYWVEGDGWVTKTLGNRRISVMDESQDYWG